MIQACVNTRALDSTKHARAFRRVFPNWCFKGVAALRKLNGHVRCCMVVRANKNESGSVKQFVRGEICLQEALFDCHTFRVMLFYSFMKPIWQYMACIHRAT